MKHTILIIEDDETLLENTRELLEISGYEVITAIDGIQGVNLAKTHLPDLIISDIMMPEMDGISALERLQSDKNTCSIPFIFISVKSDPEDIRYGMNLGADDYITKPFREEDLLDAIASRLAKHAILKEKKKKKKAAHSETHIIHSLDELRVFFARYGEYVDLEKYEELYREDRHASYVYLIESGLIKIYQLDEYGKELITAILKQDDFLGFYSFKTGGTYPETAEALENSRLLRISTEQFLETLLRSQDLTIEVAQLLSENLSVMRTHLLDMAYSSVLKKTTNTILEFAEKIQRDPKQSIKISRSDLASVAGISTESFIRSLSSLKKEGLIEIIGRDIKILNFEKLHAIR